METTLHQRRGRMNNFRSIQNSTSNFARALHESGIDLHEQDQRPVSKMKLFKNRFCIHLLVIAIPMRFQIIDAPLLCAF